MNPEPGVFSQCVMHCPPAIITPVHRRRRKGLQAKRLACAHGAALVIEPPDSVGGPGLFHLVALDGLRRRIEHATVVQGPSQFHVFRMGPDQRHGRARGPAEEEFLFRDVRGVPYLLGQHSSFIGESFERMEQLLRLVPAAGRKFVMGALAGKQRPAPPDARAVEGEPSACSP